jgi:Uma2 family endonuclease
MSTAALMTVAEFEQLPDDGRVHELLEGEHLVSPFPKIGHSKLQHRLFQHLLKHCPQGGEAYMEIGYRLSEHTLLRPDLSIASAEQTDIHENEWAKGAPMLAVEIVSPSNSAREIARKISVYLRHGGREVWVVYPEERQIHVHEPNGTSRRFEDTLRSALLPTLSLDLGEVFARRS